MDRTLTAEGWLTAALTCLALGTAVWTHPSAGLAREAQATATPIVVAVCPRLYSVVPAMAIASILANPHGRGGFGMPCLTGLPPGPFNGVRRWLSLRTWGRPWHPLANPVVFACGCG
jgi:hypothetical protein